MRGTNPTTRNKFNQNPQFKLTVKERSDVVITLRQSNVLAQSRRWTSQNVALLSTGGRPLSRGRDYTREEIADSGTYTNKREVFLEAHNLNPGTYTVIPSTFNEGEERGFVLEAFSTRPGLALGPF